MVVNKMPKKKKILIIVIVSIVAIIALGIGLFFFNLRAIDKTNETVIFTINTGDSKDEIATNLKEANLIRSKYVALIYIFISGNTNIQAGNYELSRDMTTQEIITILANGNATFDERPTVRITFKEGITTFDERPTVRVTFKEGITLRNYMEILAENTNLSYDAIIEQINDPAYLETLIADYWFLTDEILNSDIYYGLEGYLYPETYEFYTDTTLDAAIRRMLNVTDINLSEIRAEIEASDYSVHEILTMAAIVEKEAVNDADRASVAQVIYTRLDIDMSLGMDVTTYYGVGKDMSEPLTTVDLNDNNPYNTRITSFIGLPVGPICNPSMSSINAVLNPSDTNYIYFFADIVTGNVYFTDNYDEFLEFQRLYG